MKRETNCFWFDVLLSWAHQIWFRLLLLAVKRAEVAIINSRVSCAISSFLSFRNMNILFVICFLLQVAGGRFQ